MTTVPAGEEKLDLTAAVPRGSMTPRTPRQEVRVGKRILVIDDEEMILDAIKVIFEDMGHSVSTQSDPVKGTEEALMNDYDLVLTDIRMPSRNGAEITEAILARKPSARRASAERLPSHPG